MRWMGTALLALVLAATSVVAPVAAVERGPVTNLPLPRFVSMKAGEANIRRGPSRAHRIDWIFHRRNTPLEVTAEYGHWRRVRDADGAGGWVHYSLLSGARFVLVRGIEMAPLYGDAATNAPLVAQAEEGAVLRLGNCGPAFCRVSAEGHRGWALREHLWGVGKEAMIAD